MASVLVVGQDKFLLAHQVAKKLKKDIMLCSITQFADSEIFLSLSDSEKIPQSRIILVYQFATQNAGSMNDQLMGLFASVDHLKKIGAQAIDILLPYLPYARQDQTVFKNYDGAAFMIGRCLKALGAQNIYACDLHALSICSHYPLPLYNFSLENFWAKFITQNIVGKQSLDNFCIVSPDEGGRERAEKIASLHAIATGFIRKKRVSFDTAVCYELVGEVRGKQVILIDDIIDTAQTATSACDLLIEHGALCVYGLFSHAILAPGALDRLATSKFARVFVTDTVVGNGQKCGDNLEVISINEFLAEHGSDLMLQSSIF